MFYMKLVVPVTAIVVALLAHPSTAIAAKWKICGSTASSFQCTTVCGYVIASYPTHEECVAAKKKIRLPPNKLNQRAQGTGKPAGTAGLAECRKRYGKSVTSAVLLKDGKTLMCYHSITESSDPVVVRDACKKRFGPTSQIRRHRGKWYCTQA
jgi:hypothetical protein